MPAATSTHPPIAVPSQRPRAFVANAVIADKYVLVRKLGAGGMGVVWVAHNRILDVHVALKLIDLEQTSNPRRMAVRLLQEARAAARIAHPAICRVFDFGETDAGDPFIVSELLHGETLGTWISERPRVDSLRAVQLLLPIMDGLASAHAKGIIHRDIKPDNIFLSRDDVSRLQPKLLDFGIARRVDNEQKITLDGALLGTPDYMSPEQARGEGDIDARTDVWGVGVVLYELVTGTRPFGGDNYNALLWAISHEEPVPITDLGAGDTELRSILDRALAKDRTARWSTMRELGSALAEWLLARGVTEDISGASLRAAWFENAPITTGERPRSTATPVETPVVPRPPSAADVRQGAVSGAATDWRAGRSAWGLPAMAAGVAAIVGFVLVLVVVGPRSARHDRSGEAVPPGAAAVPAERPRPRATPAAAKSGAPAATDALETATASAAVSAAPNEASSASTSVRVVPHRPRRKPDPRTYDFGF